MRIIPPETNGLIIYGRLGLGQCYAQNPSGLAKFILKPVGLSQLAFKPSNFFKSLRPSLIGRNIYVSYIRDDVGCEYAVED